MTPREAYRFGFLTRCAEEGLSLEEVERRVTAAIARKEAALSKSAGGPAAPLLFGLGAGFTLKDALKSGTKAVLSPYKLLFWLALSGIPLTALMGFSGGHLLGQGLDDPEMDVEAVKNRELAAAYDLHSELIRQRTQAQRNAARAAKPLSVF